jgi:hypothetical protein
VTALQEKGIIDGLLKTLGPPSASTRKFHGTTSHFPDMQDLDESLTTSQMLASLKANKRILHVKILGGKAFLEQLFPNEEKVQEVLRDIYHLSNLTNFLVIAKIASKFDPLCTLS